MQCIFCKKNSDTSRSVEHIIPESLGNTEHILAQGIVCDNCNNYFAIKIEQPLLQLPHFISSRHRNKIENKKGRIPIDKGILLAPTPTIANFHLDKDANSISFDDESIFDFFESNDIFSIIMPTNEKPPEDNIFISKFLGKVGLETLARIGVGVEHGIQELIDKVELDAIRNYVRYGKKIKFWPYYCRPLYSEDAVFVDTQTGIKFQILHEHKLLYTDNFQLLIIVVLFGFEYCLDLGQPTTENYLKWLKDNNYKSPLQRERNL